MFISNPDFPDDSSTMDSGYTPPPPGPPTRTTTLDDVFGDHDAAPHHDAPREEATLSDMPRLEREHATAGYRDGVTAAKGASVQAGFDEGFSLGAEIGKKVGEMVGLLEGIYEAVGGGDEVLARAREEMTKERMFGQEYWHEDGTWRYEVGGREESIVFADVADAHPLVRKWAAVVEEEVSRWGIDMDVLGKSTEEAEEARKRDDVLEVSARPPAGETKKNALDW